MKGLLNNFYIRIITLVFLTSFLTWCAIEEEWILGTVGLPFWCGSFIYFIKYDKYYVKKVAIILDAIENNDHSFHYPEYGISPNDILINKFLNRINHLVAQTKVEVIQKEKYFELILNSISTGIVVLDDKGFVYQSNQAALKILGLSVFTNLSQLRYIDENLDAKFKAIQSSEKHQISFNTEQRTVTLSIRSSDMMVKDQHVRLLALSDIKNELDEKEIEAWVRLIRVLTHEIMNSITPITSLSDTLLELHTSECKDIRDGLKVIRDTGKNLTKFVESYRKFTHIPKPEASLFYVHKFMERMIQLAQHQCENSSNIRYVCHIEPEDMILYADENLISQVMLNILKNANQAILSEKQEGTIEITASSNDDGSITIAVSNDGPMIPTEEREHIFVPFYTTKENGSGIGLALSRQIMRMSGGNLTLQSSESSHKTIFSLIFP